MDLFLTLRWDDNDEKAELISTYPTARDYQPVLLPSPVIREQHDSSADETSGIFPLMTDLRWMQDEPTTKEQPPVRRFGDTPLQSPRPLPEFVRILLIGPSTTAVEHSTQTCTREDSLEYSSNATLHKTPLNKPA